jgi:ribose 5-phosphate isomerase B
MRIAFGTDDATHVTMAMLVHLRELGHEVDVVAYPEGWGETGRLVGQAVASERADLGVVCCFTGTGVSIAANKVTGVRAALCVDAETATGARRWNDANVLAVSLRLTTEQRGRELLDAFLAEVDADPSQAPIIARLEG